MREAAEFLSVTVPLLRSQEPSSPASPAPRRSPQTAAGWGHDWCLCLGCGSCHGGRNEAFSGKCGLGLHSQHIFHAMCTCFLGGHVIFGSFLPPFSLFFPFGFGLGRGALKLGACCRAVGTFDWTLLDGLDLAHWTSWPLDDLPSDGCAMEPVARLRSSLGPPSLQHSLTGLLPLP